jgi:hypothetical protein
MLLLIPIKIRNYLIKIHKITKKNHILCFLLFTFLIMGRCSKSTYASAQQQPRACMYNGILYPHGTIIGEYICQDGRWVRIQQFM